MKVFAVLMLVLAGLVPVHADSWEITASCDLTAAVFVPCTDPAKINAVFTTQLETGMFLWTDGESNVLRFGTHPVVTNISGTFDGLAMTLVPVPTWDWLNYSFGNPEAVTFTAGGIEYSLSIPGFEPQIFPLSEFLTWSAIDPVSAPEPGALALLASGLLTLIALRRPRTA
jgi:hypothetical protein